MSKLREAERGNDVDTLREALQACETDQTLRKAQELRDATKTLKAIDSARGQILFEKFETRIFNI